MAVLPLREEQLSAAREIQAVLMDQSAEELYEFAAQLISMGDVYERSDLQTATYSKAAALANLACYKALQDPKQ